MPDARLALRIWALSDCGHARVVVWMRQIEAAARRSVASIPAIRPIVADTIVDRLIHVAQVAGRIWHTIFRGTYAAGPWLIKSDGQWQLYSIEERAEAFRLLFEQIAPFGSERERFLEPPLPRIFSWMRDRVVDFASLRARWVVSPRPKLAFDLDQHLQPFRQIRSAYCNCTKAGGNIRGCCEVRGNCFAARQKC